VPRALPHGVPAVVPGRSPSPAGRGAPAHDAAPAPEPVPGARPVPSGARRAAEPGGSGPDLGWALACLGLLLAAALLGGTEEGRSAASRSRARLGALLRPLTGRS
jgi:hypothetical protein